MMHKICEELEKKGVNMNSVTARFMENESLYIKFLLRFKEDENFRDMQNYFKNGEVEEAFKSAHTLKGLLANLGLDSIMQSVNMITEKLRNGSAEGVKDLMEQAEEEYNIILEVLREE